MKTQKFAHIINVFLILLLLILTSCEETVKSVTKVKVDKPLPIEVSLATAPPISTNIVGDGNSITASKIVLSWTAGSLESNKHLAKTGIDLTSAQISYKIYVVKKDAISKSAEQIKANPDKVIDVPPEETNATVSNLEASTLYILVVESINITDITQNSLSAITELGTVDTVVTISLLGGAANLHQSIRDMIMPNNTVIATIAELAENTEYTYVFGDRVDVRTTIDRKIEITKADLLPSTTATDGTELHLIGNGDNITVATYRPFEIYSWQDLQAMRLNLTGNYSLINDITFPEAGAGEFPVDGFEPIAFDTNNTPIPGTVPNYDGNPFRGSLDGQNQNGGVYSIYNLRINRGDQDFTGLFGQMSSGTIQNLKIVRADIIGRQCIGVIVGNLEGIANILNVGVEDSTIYGTDVVGGIVGHNQSRPIKGYASNMIITGKDYVGGLVGTVYGAQGSTIGYATGTIAGKDHVGGLVGRNEQNALVIGYTQGTVSGENFVGGLIGSHTDPNASTGYTRVKLVRSSGSISLRFGYLTGNTIPIVGYYSAYENTVVPPTIGVLGTALPMKTATTQTDFTTITPAFDFSAHWIWVEDGKWPAINIGTAKPAAEQPITPVYSVATAPPTATIMPQVPANTTTSTLGIGWTTGILTESHLSGIGTALTSAQVHYKIYAVKKVINAVRTSAEVKASATANMEVAAGTLNVTISSLDPATEYEIIVEAINSTDTDVTSLSDVATFSTN